MKTTIIPEIKKIRASEETLKLSHFYLDTSVTTILPIAGEIFENNERGDALYPITYTPADLEPEEYHITVLKDSINIMALSARGLMYALFTLSELALINNDKLNECHIEDSPALNFRALSDDISRGQVSRLDNFFDIIKKLARYKYNCYMPYIEDMFRFNCCPDWGKYSDPLSQAEWRVIIEFAKSYCMDVRPIVNLLGHFDKSCKIESLQPMAIKTADGKVTSVIDPTSEQAKELIPKMLKEIVSCFGEGAIHCGGDEPVALTEVFGKERGAELFIEHYTFVSKELKKLNCSMIVYADFFAPPWGDYAVPVDRAKELPSDTEFVFWDYAVRDAYPFVDALHKQGLKLYISPGTWTWQRFSCDIKTCFNNTKGLLSADDGRSRGMIMSSWADGGDTLRELTWPGVVIGGNFCWSPKSQYSYNEFYDIYHKSFFGFDTDESGLLDSVYHHDSVIKRKDQHEFKKLLYKDPAEGADFEGQESVSILQAAMRKAEADMSSLTPLRNCDAFNALKYTVAAATFIADKIAILSGKQPQSVEQLMARTKGVYQLTGELLWLKEIHRRLWFDTARQTDWERNATRYDEAYYKLLAYAKDIYRPNNIE